MGLTIYSNGIFEEYLPSEETFNEAELANMFDDYEEIQSFRLPEIPNCWIIWGYMDNPPENEYNTIASEIIGEKVYSHMIFLHDSELNQNWGVTDNILYKSYEDFISIVGEYIRGLVEHIAINAQQQYEEEGSNSMVFLRVVGHTKDKRVLYQFDPDEQHETFYTDVWGRFAKQILKYLKDNFNKEPIEKNKPLVIFADSKVIVVVDDKKVNNVISRLLKEFEEKENYEACSFISDVKDKWYERKTILKQNIDPSTGKIKRRRGRPPKRKDNDEEAND